MKTRVLGSSGIKVGEIGLGCMGMNWAYGRAEEKDALHVIDHAIDLGVTLIDTADVYGPYTNEELVGRAIRSRRHNVVIATKGGNIVRDAARFDIIQDGSPAHILAACDASLRRLGIDHIDLYYLHRPDPNIPIEESVGALGALLDAGKIRAIGLSECSLELLDRAIVVRPIAALQSELSLWTQDPLKEIVPWCVANGVGFVAYAPLGRGFFAGEYSSSERIQAGDFRAVLPRFQHGAIERNLAIVEQIRMIARKVGATPGQVSLAWLLAKGTQIVPIPGTTRILHLEENLGAAQITLNDDDITALDSLPKPRGDRY